MIKSKESFGEFIGKRLDLYALNKNAVETMQTYLVETYKFRIGEASDLITQRTPLTTESTFVCFCVCDALSKVDNKTIVSDWFTEKEISAFSHETIQRNGLTFPILIPAIQITDDQWIGVCDCKFLMQLRDEQKLYYNTNTQRTLQRILKHGQESYRIMLNKSAVKDIQTAYENETYIPDTISLNLSEDSEYWYNSDKRELVIESFDHFDIIDGFHRYTAMCKEIDMNPDFNYSMELRIVQYDEVKAKQFIWQQDQKTKMKKIDSDSLNVSAPENVVAEKLNRNPMFNYHGEINRSGGLIPLPDFVNIVKYLYFKKVNKTEERKLINAVSADLMDKLNYMTDTDEELLKHKFSRLETIILITVCSVVDDKEKLIDTFNHTVEEVNKDTTLRHRLVAAINKPRIDRVISLMERK